MWIVIRFIVSIVFASHVFLAGDALAQDAGARDAPPEPTRIEVDSESGEIHFYIEGNVAAVLKADGLHVRESIGYGGTLTDYGTEGFSAFGKQDVKEADDAAE
ncbi:MAG: hypothetical protein ACU0AY_01075 [Marinibacterium profundimaris]